MSGLTLGLNRPTAHGVVVPPALQRVAGNNLAYAIGDSRTRVTQGPAGGYNQGYPHTTARQMLMGQMDLNFATIVGTSGYTTQQVQENLFPDALASDAKTLILLVGTNDVGSNPATVAGRIATMADAWVESEPDRVIHILDEAPWVDNSGSKSGHAELRDHIRALSDPAGGINIVPSWQAITGGNDGNTPAADAYRDNVHFSIPGAMRVGRVLAQSLAPTLPAFDFHGRATNLAQTFAAGSLASNDMNHNASLSSGSYATSMVTFEDEVWLQVELDEAIGTVNIYRSSSTVPGGWTTGVTQFESNIDFVLLDGHENIRKLALGAFKQSGALQPHYSTAASVMDGDHSGSDDDAIDLSYPDGDELRGTLWTPRYVLAGDATQLRPWWVQLTSRTSLAMSGTLLIRRPQCRVIS